MLNHFKDLPDLLLLVDNAIQPIVGSILEKGQVKEINENLPEWIKKLLNIVEKMVSNDTIDDIRAKYNQIKKGD